MSATLHLIAEGQTEDEIVRAILRRKFPLLRISISQPPGNNPNLSRLARHLETLIQQALEKKKAGDCIAVLHDDDRLTRPNDRQDYEQIAQICRKYKHEVVHVVARDEIESWLLADEGICKYLGITARNRDSETKPSERLENYLDKANKPKYRIENLRRILKDIQVDNNHSPSFNEALQHLNNAPCVKP